MPLPRKIRNRPPTMPVIRAGGALLTVLDRRTAAP
jgi:hypothetical protein